MAPITLYDVSIAMHIQVFEVFQSILQKARDHAPEESASYPSARLYEDMLPLSAQIQIASNTAKKFAARVAPNRGPYEAWDDNETTMDELFVRIDKTLALLKAVKPEDLDGRDAEIFETTLGGGRVFKAPGSGMALGLALPNIFFHVVTAYDILRHKGVPLGKTDYLASFMVPHNVAKEE